MFFYHENKLLAFKRVVFLGDSISENTTRRNLKFVVIDGASLK